MCWASVSPGRGRAPGSTTCPRCSPGRTRTIFGTGRGIRSQSCPGCWRTASTSRTRRRSCGSRSDPIRTAPAWPAPCSSAPARPRWPAGRSNWSSVPTRGCGTGRSPPTAPSPMRPRPPGAPGRGYGTMSATTSARCGPRRRHGTGKTWRRAGSPARCGPWSPPAVPWTPPPPRTGPQSWPAPRPSGPPRPPARSSTASGTGSPTRGRRSRGWSRPGAPRGHCTTPPTRRSRGCGSRGSGRWPRWSALSGSTRPPR